MHNWLDASSSNDQRVNVNQLNRCNFCLRKSCKSLQTDHVHQTASARPLRPGRFSERPDASAKVCWPLVSIYLAPAWQPHLSLTMADTRPSTTSASPSAGTTTSSGTESAAFDASFERWRTGLAMFTGLGLSEAEKAEREKTLELQKLEKDWDKCEQWKKDLMKSSEFCGSLLPFVLPRRAGSRGQPADTSYREPPRPEHVVACLPPCGVFSIPRRESYVGQDIS